MEDWEKAADNPSLLAVQSIPSNVNKWAGEDEDDVKDSWDVEDEKKDEEKVEIKMVKTKPKKSLAEKIAEKERIKQEEEEAKIAQREAELSPEQKLQEKLRLQKVQEEADLRAAMDTFGIGDRCGIDQMNPTNKAELSEFSEAINKKIGQFKQLTDYPHFVEELVRGVCSSCEWKLTSTDMQKIKKTVDTLYSEKQKMEKEKSKKGSKGKGKATIRKIEDNENIKDYGDDAYDYDDFM
ncbi:Eukaryotic translation initiation factor 3 subunit J [Pseudolycoriella hygida]|uniref:Eukaryotic translation initiation factor 3 subunit J n=1 Tax=Pseudolycoriella hygida TaxID=35572 RepID=A0A9Q0MR04_9DIPT|nr:Eukaryotic translation initiation factor 3 subunit J [Pseudolycoriella hygida]